MKILPSLLNVIIEWVSRYVGESVVGGFNKTPETETKLAPVSGEELQGRKR